MITEQQYRRLMTTYHQSGVVSHAALKAGMHRETAARYIEGQVGPGQRKAPHNWRTRPDPLEALWLQAKPWLEASPELEVKALFEHLLGADPALAPGHALRTFQRRVRQWRAQNGPPREVHFPQVREPGQSVQLDWTHADELVVTIAGAAFNHWLCHVVLPYSNWQWAVPCRSESLLSLRIGLQAALQALGGVPIQLQTDQSSTATHTLDRLSKKRGFNIGYLALCEHYQLQPTTIHVACPNENGDIESANGHLKRRLKNHLILRGSHDFASEAAYGEFVGLVCTGANLLRQAKVAEERPRLRPLPATRFPEAEELTVRVSSYSTIRAKNCAYSVPSNYVGYLVQVRVSESEVSIHYLGTLVATFPRSLSHEPRIDYRHIIASLVRKPGAFQRCVYREQLFPTLSFRQAYDRLVELDPGHAEIHYVQILALAADTGEAPVDEALSALLREDQAPTAERVRARLVNVVAPAILDAFTPELTSYDRLSEVQEVSA
jgi:transposase InsO family protein